MAKYLINGGNRLKGTLTISGNKNSILPCLAACILTDQEVILENVPKISDVDVFIQIMRHLGAQVNYEDHTVRACCQKMKCHDLPADLMNKLRASVLFIGPLLSRCGKVEFSHPGGDVIGKRSIDIHLEGIKQLGFSFKNNDHHYWGNANRQHKFDCQVFLEEASVTATENLILSSVIGTRSVVLKNCAKEPHIVDLCHMLTKMGAVIEGIGTPTLNIRGVGQLMGTSFTVGADFIEFGTYAIAAAITKGSIQISRQNLPELDPIIMPLMKMGLKFEVKDDVIEVSAGEILPIPKLVTNVWPGFPTDLMSVVIVLATQARGVSLCHDWMFESRMFFVDKLISMGAQITIADPHRVVIYGPTQLQGRTLETPDIRAGMALLLSALIAKGSSKIDKAELIERGYEDVVGKLVILGADITRINE